MQPRFCVGDEVCRFTQGFLEKGTVVELDPPRERIKVRREDGRHFQWQSMANFVLTSSLVFKPSPKVPLASQESLAEVALALLELSEGNEKHHMTPKKPTFMRSKGVSKHKSVRLIFLPR